MPVIESRVRIPNQGVFWEGRVLVWISWGAASACAGKLAIEKYGERALLVNCDTSRSEHPDNKRFGRELEKWYGREIILLQSSKYTTVEEVFEDTRYMSGEDGARCTVELKKRPRFAFQDVADIHVFGYTTEEKKRISDFEQRNPELFLEWILRDRGMTKADCFKMLTDAGIALPVMYALGFKNNNCLGCVKATSPKYWNMTRTHFPEVFERRCEQSRRLGVRLVRYKGERIFLDELPPDAGQSESMPDISCGPQCSVEAA
jgi:hypothetical protein